MEHFDRRQHDREMEEMRRKMEEMQTGMRTMEEKIDELNESVSGLVTSWNTGKAASAFLIGTAKLATAGAVVWAVLKNIKWSQIFL